MADPFASPCVLVVADRDRIGELVLALSELRQVEVLVSSGGDDTIELFEARLPAVVVVTASLHSGDAKALVVTLRGMLPRAEVAVVVVGDDAGPIRTALDALDLAPDRFVTRPLSPKALRFAVTGGIDAVRIVRGGGAAPRPLRQTGQVSPVGRGGEPVLPPVPPLSASAMTRLPLESPGIRAAPVAAPVSVHDAPTAATRAALRARWEALADSISDGDDEAGSDAAAAPAEAAPPILIKPRRHAIDGVLDAPIAAALLAPVAAPQVRKASASEPPVPARVATVTLGQRGADTEIVPAMARTHTGDGQVVVAARTSSDELWSEAMPISELVDRESRVEIPILRLSDDELAAPSAGLTEAVGAGRGRTAEPADDQMLASAQQLAELAGSSARRRRGEPTPTLPVAEQLAEPVPDDATVIAREAAQPEPEPAAPEAEVGEAGEAALDAASEARDFARELRAKMSMMARRLFDSDAAPSFADHAPRHDHHTEIDLAALGDEPALEITDIEARPESRHEPREAMAAPGPGLPGAPGSSGSWDSQVRERGLADSGALVRGVSDAAMLLAKMFAQGATGRIGFRRDEVETMLYFDRGRPVFASSNEPRDRMGELLLREGKITAAQYERCQTVVAESGRRMGEILVGFGYLKRRELLPAVRRHVEDLVYSLFSWDRGSYRITLDPQPCAERIRLSRHPAALILEGIRRKLDRPALERLVGPPSTVLEVPDRDRLGGIVNLGDLVAEERAALTAFDGQADLAQVARSSGTEVADVLPLAWGLCVLGLATARRADTDIPDDGTALVGETDLAIDRERVRARWQLVSDADYFALLGVRRDATGFEIRRAYQSARRDFAADCFPGDLRRELARELDDIASVLDEAFRVLRDDRLRLTYLANLIDE